MDKGDTMGDNQGKSSVNYLEGKNHKKLNFEKRGHRLTRDETSIQKQIENEQEKGYEKPVEGSTGKDISGRDFVYNLVKPSLEKKTWRGRLKKQRKKILPQGKRAASLGLRAGAREEAQK